MDEKLLGGFINGVVRREDEVRRTAGERAGFVHELLGVLVDWPGSPTYLGLDEDGRERLSFIDGYVPWDRPWKAAITTPEALRSVGRLVREFHDLTAGTALAGDEEVVCHNDLSPKNTVYTPDGTRAIAFIDWDIAAPGPRIHDIAFICWQYATDTSHWQALLSGYGSTDLTALVPTVLWWQTRAADGIEARAADGDTTMQHLVDLDVPADIRRSRAWVEVHADELQRLLGGRCAR
ncbi:phosphotransferase [Kribbella sp. NPDC026611]|uniref:phosphotransferase n=1 Tax=Kribbella sp. NPDC026611 TaxID=3154911 RepID=UPI00340FF5CE